MIEGDADARFAIGFGALRNVRDMTNQAGSLWHDGLAVLFDRLKRLHHNSISRLCVSGIDRVLELSRNLCV